MLKKQTKTTKKKATTKDIPKPEKKPAKSAKKEPFTFEEPSISESKPGLGKKHTCFNCGTKFYDLGNPGKPCPKCGADQSVKPVTKIKPRVIKSEFDIDEDEIPVLVDEDDIIIEPEDDLELEDETLIGDED